MAVPEVLEIEVVPAAWGAEPGWSGELVLVPVADLRGALECIREESRCDA